MNDQPLLTFRSVSRSYVSGGRPVVALADIDLRIDAGEVVAIHGPSGSGKSTLLNLAAGWDLASSGEIERAPSVEHGWSGMAIVPQAIGLILELTVEENIELARFDRGHSVPAEQAAASKILGRLGLDPLEYGKRFPEELSLGQQQRVALARAVVGEPKLVIADEPTAHQDEANARVIFDELRTLAQRGSGVLVSTHDVRLLDRVDRTVAVVDGRIVP